MMTRANTKKMMADSGDGTEAKRGRGRPRKTAGRGGAGDTAESAAEEQQDPTDNGDISSPTPPTTTTTRQLRQRHTENNHVAAAASTPAKTKAPRISEKSTEVVKTPSRRSRRSKQDKQEQEQEQEEEQEDEEEDNSTTFTTPPVKTTPLVEVIRKSSKASKSATVRKDAGFAAGNESDEELRQKDGVDAQSLLLATDVSHDDAPLAEAPEIKKLDFGAIDKGDDVDDDDDEQPEAVSSHIAKSKALGQQAKERSLRQQAQQEAKAKRKAIDERNKQQAQQKKLKVGPKLPETLLKEVAQREQHEEVEEDDEEQVRSQAQKRALEQPQSKKRVNIKQTSGITVVALDSDEASAATRTVPPAVANFKQQHLYGDRLQRAAGHQDPSSKRRRVATVFTRK